MSEANSVTQSLSRHWLAISLSSILLLAAGAGFALAKSPVYTAQARVLVGSYDSRIASIPGIVTATQSLAQTYSRLLTTEGGIQAASQAGQIPRSQISGHVSASAVIASPMISVTGTALNQADAQKFANAGASGLSAYVKAMNPNSSEAILQQFQDVNRQLLSAQGELADMTAKSKASPNDRGLASATVQKNAEVAGLQLQLSALSTSYPETVSSGAFGLQTIQPAVAMGSNRKSTVEFYGCLGLLSGFIISAALCTLRDSRHSQRHARHAAGTVDAGSQQILVPNS